MIPRWEKTEPVRLYMYLVVGAFLAIAASVGYIIDMDARQYIWLAGMALGTVSGTEFARSSVDSPATVKHKFDRLPDEVKKALDL